MSLRFLCFGDKKFKQFGLRQGGGGDAICILKCFPSLCVSEGFQLQSVEK